MRLAHFHSFAPVCPVCRRAGREPKPLVIASVGEGTVDEIEAGILHCADAACQHEFPIVDGTPIIVPDLRQLLSDRATEILLRDDLDPAIESLLGDATGPDSWYSALRQGLSTYLWDAYGDLDPEEAAPQPGGPAPGAARRCLDRLLALAAEPAAAPGRVVDLGCAGGRTSFALAARYADALVLGIDTNIALLRAARSAGRGQMSYFRRRIGVVYDRRRFAVTLEGRERVDFWACDALALPFAAGAAQLVSALNLLDCVPEPRKLLAGVAELLAPAGRAVFATPYDWASRATPMETWIGGHSQRAAHGGAAEPFLRALLQPGAHAQSVDALRLTAEEMHWPWATRLHDRGAVNYLTHLFTLEKSPAIPEGRARGTTPAALAESDPLGLPALDDILGPPRPPDVPRPLPDPESIMRIPFIRETPPAPAPVATGELPGFFGKVPTVGDFLARRVPRDFAPRWEEWLQVLLVESRREFGADWHSAWLEMPVWHFVLGSGVVARHRVYGVLIPSVDRVGREFPLTIFGIGQARGTPLARWALAAEALALAALGDGFTAARLDSDLTALGAPEDREPYDGSGPALKGISALAAPSDWPAEIDRMIGTLAPGETLWWCRGSARVAPVALRCQGLPAADEAAGFLGRPGPPVAGQPGEEEQDPLDALLPS